MWGTVVNLSAAGMLVELGFPLAPGTDWISRSSFRRGLSVAGWGQIVRRATRPATACASTALKDDAIERLRRFVSKREEGT